MNNKDLADYIKFIQQKSKTLRDPKVSWKATMTDIRDERGKLKKKPIVSSYEMVADYLFTEGYASSFEDALIVADCISEKWYNEIAEAWIRKDPWEISMAGHDKSSPATIAIGRSLNSANRGGIRTPKPSTLASMERQARRLEKTNNRGHQQASAIRAMARHLTKVTPNQRKVNWFSNRQELSQ